MQNWIKLTFLCLYIADVINVIIAIRLDIRKYYAVTKSLLLPLLLITYLLFLPENTRLLPYQKFAILALICHWEGDVFLLFPKDKSKIWFYLGTLSFFAGHIFYILWFAQPCWAHSVTNLIIAISVSLAIQILLTCQLLRINKKLGLFLVLYSSGLAALLAAAASAENIIASIGVLVFWVSDYTIARREIKIKTLGQMATMVTYMLAQTLIVLGMYMVQI